MADAPTGTTQLVNDTVSEFIAREMFTLAERTMQLNKYATPYKIPERMGTKLRAVRVKRLALPTKPLATEGTPPDAVAMAVEKQEVTVEQWGIVVLLTDVGELTTSHPMLQVAIDRVGRSMAEMAERETAEVLLSGTNVVFGGTASTRAGIVAADKFDTSTNLKATTQLRARGAFPLVGSLYGGVIPPQVEADLIASDAIFKAVITGGEAALELIEMADIGDWAGVRWTRGNFLPIFRGETAPASGDVDATNSSATDGILEGDAGSGGTWTANSTVKVKIVARDKDTDYERKISQEASFALGAGNTRLRVRTPNSANYVYDIYVSDDVGGGGTARLSASVRVAADTIATVNAAATTAAVPPAVPADDREVFVAWVFGKDAYGRVQLNGMSLRSFLTPSGPSFSNPLAQGRKVGAKWMWKAFILDDAYMVRIEAASAFSALLPA